MAEEHYRARKTENSDTWEIVNTATDEVVDFGLTEEQAKELARVSNKMADEVEKEGSDV